MQNRESMSKHESEVATLHLQAVQMALKADADKSDLISLTVSAQRLEFLEIRSNGQHSVGLV